MKRLNSAFLACATALALFPSALIAQTFDFSTPSGAKDTVGDPVDASAVITLGTGTITITLTDSVPNIKDVGQAITDFEFTLGSGVDTGTLNSSSGTEVYVASHGVISSSSAVTSTHWVLNNSVNGGFQLDTLGSGQPKDAILGPPNGSHVYSNANSSIASNGPHNPFLENSGTFTIDAAGVLPTDTVTGATFSFGTTAGDDVTGTNTTPIVSAPEGGAALLYLLLAGGVCFGTMLFKSQHLAQL